MSSVGIYIHIPFCLRKCPYCDFYSLVCGDQTKRQYVKALINDISENGGKSITADTVYFGGGTPTVLSARQLCDILRAVKESFLLSDDAELTIEANPCTVNEKYLCKLKQAGFNRISFGVQSCDDRELESLGRLHNVSQAREAVLSAYAAGFTNISCDLMLGTIGQTEESVINSVDTLCSLPITHVSAYMLKIEEGTPYDCEGIRSKIADDEFSAALYLSAVRRLEARSFEQYEISNFCKNGLRSRHNMKYWRLEDYIGFGCSAHSFYCGKRSYYGKDIDAYIKDRCSIHITEDASPDMLTEYTMLALRTADGLDTDRFAALGGDTEKLRDLARQLVDHNMAVYDNGLLRLTPEGFLVSNSIIVRLLPEAAF